MDSKTTENGSVTEQIQKVEKAPGAGIDTAGLPEDGKTPQEDEAIITLADAAKLVHFDRNEDSLWKKVGEFIRDNAQLAVPENQLQVYTGKGACTLTFTGKKDRPIKREGTIPLKKCLYKPKHLAKIDPETNLYEFYKLIPNTMGDLSLDVGGSFGRIGAGDRDLDARTVIRPPFSSCLYWPMYELLLSKGYTDNSELIEEEEDDILTEINDEDPAANELWEKFHGAAQQVITETMDIDINGPDSVTRKQVSSCKTLHKKMSCEKDLDKINAHLLKFLTLSNVRIDKYRGMTVKSYLIKKTDDPVKQQKLINEKLEWVEGLILAMEAMVGPEKKRDFERKSPFGDVDVRTPTEDEIAEVRKLVAFAESNAPGDRQMNIKNIYRIIPGEQRKRFEAMLETMEDKTVKLLWHGAPTGSFCSIVMNSLSLSYANSGMFSAPHQGLYTAPDCRKSAGYTDGGRWNGSSYSRTFFLAVFETAYGKPWFVDGPGHYTRQDVEAHHANCIHARKDKAGVRRTEIIFPYEESLCMKYIVEFEDAA